ncbi:sigma-70 domain-containing protein [Bacillus altitudinis]|nr:sigma-70 domain-containing protein [Bacillus altitudinis]
MGEEMDLRGEKVREIVKIGEEGVCLERGIGEEDEWDVGDFMEEEEGSCG